MSGSEGTAKARRREGDPDDPRAARASSARIPLSPSSRLRVFAVLSRPLRCAALTLLLALAAGAAEDPYARWQAGDAAGAAPLIAARARADGRWSSWLDAGLAAADAGDRGHAVGWLLAALRRAPELGEPREALAALDAAPPTGWLAAIGPLAWPGLGWPAIVLAGAAGALVGAAILDRRARRLLPLAAIACVAIAPGAIARRHDAMRPLAAIAADTRLLDSAGEAHRALAAGTLVWREPRAPWAGRLLVRTADGAQGYVPSGDLVDE